MIDLHTHILPGVDDGALTLADSLQLARDAVRDGVTALAATPHVREDYPTSAETMERLVGVVSGAIRDAGLPLRLVGGGEIALGPLTVMGADELRRFSLGGSGRYLLVEFPYHGWPLPLAREVDRLRRLGIRVVIAHPERNGEVQERPGRIAPLVDAGALVQLTAASVDGRLGRRADRASGRLIEMGLAHLVASDAHMPGVREAGLSDAAEALGEPLARWMTLEVPAAILSGAPTPPRPPRRRRWLSP